MAKEKKAKPAWDLLQPCLLDHACLATVVEKHNKEIYIGPFADEKKRVLTYLHFVQNGGGNRKVRAKNTIYGMKKLRNYVDAAGLGLGELGVGVAVR